VIAELKPDSKRAKRVRPDIGDTPSSPPSITTGLCG
jgi:hypothetical protein